MPTEMIIGDEGTFCNATGVVNAAVTTLGPKPHH